MHKLHVHDRRSDTRSFSLSVLALHFAARILSEFCQTPESSASRYVSKKVPYSSSITKALSVLSFMLYMRYIIHNQLVGALYQQNFRNLIRTANHFPSHILQHIVSFFLPLDWKGNKRWATKVSLLQLPFKWMRCFYFIDFVSVLRLVNPLSPSSDKHLISP